MVLENDDLPSTSCKGDDGMAKSQSDLRSSHEDGISGVEVKSQKDRLNCSASYVLVSCHLEMLRHSVADDLHLTQVS